MTRNQLPEGVGKKIVEALKRQAETDVTPVQSTEENNLKMNEVEEPKLQFDTLQEISSQQNEEIIEESEQVNNTEIKPNIASTFDMPVMKEEIYTQQPVKDPVPETPIFKAGSETTTITFNKPVNKPSQTFSGVPLSEETQTPPAAYSVNISIPTNVAVLKNLIASLPVGVTKQTGAQIIRQTLEAMGIPMSGVLKEAQEVQEELNANTRECMLRIQEFKTNIMQLEQSVQEYQKNITQINDLVSLFLLTDRK